MLLKRNMNKSIIMMIIYFNKKLFRLDCDCILLRLGDIPDVLRGSLPCLEAEKPVC